MSSGEWWTDANGAAGDFNPNQTAAAQDQFDSGGGTTYAGPGQQAPIDQYNFTPDPNLPGGFAVNEPGSEAPLDQSQFSTLNGNYPDQSSMAQAVAAQTAAGMQSVMDESGNAMTAMPSSYQVTAQPQQYASQSGVYVNPTAGALPNNLAYAQSMPGYRPGAMTYNQWNLADPGLLGTVAGTPNVNLRYGQGGTGDPTNGMERQTPQEWVQGGKLFNSTRQSNWGQGDQAGTGLDYIATTFLRPDTPSGINTSAWGAPEPYWQGLAQQIAAGNIQPTNRGWALLQARGMTPQTVGGAAMQQAQSVGVQASGQGASGTSSVGSNPAPGAPRVASATGATGPMGAGTEAWNYNRALIDLQTAGLAQNSQQFADKLAFDRAVQQFREEMGRQQTSLGYLGLTSQLRGPGDLFQYLKVLGGTPGGIRDVVNAAAGKYNMPRTGGGQVTVGGYSNPSDLGDLLDQMNDPNYGDEANNLNLPPPNQISAANLARMSPAQQKVLLAAYEAAGYNVEDVTRIFQNSLPQYAATQGGAGRVNLF